MSTTADHWLALAVRLRERGVRHVFGLPGDGLEAWHAFTSAGLRFHLVNDQRHGGYQAIASVLVREQPFGVLVLGKGPAVTHAATALLEAREQRVPLLVVSSGVNPQLLGTGAFQELNATETTAPLTHGHATAKTPDEVPGLVDSLIDRCLFARRGPVHLEIPEGLAEARATGDATADQPPVPETDCSVPSPSAPEATWWSILETARRPALLLGGGARHSEAGRLQEMVQSRHMAVLCTASGRSCFDEEDHHFIGVSGLYLPEQSRPLVQDVDVLLVLGSRLEETATLGWDLSGTTVIQVNADPVDIRDSIPGPHIVATADRLIDALLARGEATGVDPGWMPRIRQTHEALVAPDAVARPSAVAGLLRALSAGAPQDLVSVHENGLQDIWSYTCGVWPISGGMTCVVPSEQTPLGFGASAAVGVARVQSRPVLAIMGDGAFSGLGSELAHLRDLCAPLILLVLNNGGYGWLQANLDASRRDRPEACSSSRSPQPVFCHPAPGLTSDQRPDLVAGLGRAAGLEILSIDLRRQTGPGEDSALRPLAASIWDRLEPAGRTGRPVVVNVLVDLADVPPGFEELAGDVPAWAAPSVLAQGAHL